MYLRCCILIFFLFSCHAPVINKTDIIDNKSKYGVVVFSLTQDKEGPQKAHSSVYLEGATGSRLITTRNSSLSSFIGFADPSKFGNTHGKVFALKLKEGEYSLTSWQVYDGTHWRISPKNPPPKLTIKVSAGGVLYIGNMHMDFIFGKNNYLFGRTNSGVVPKITNQYDRDIAYFREQHPNFKDIEIKMELLPLGEWFYKPSTEEGI